VERTRDRRTQANLGWQLIALCLAAQVGGCGPMRIESIDGPTPIDEGTQPIRTCDEPWPAGAVWLPLSVGSSWDYLVTNSDDYAEEPKHAEVEEYGRVGGAGLHREAAAFRLVTTKAENLSDRTVSWQAWEGAKVVRYRELSYHKDGTLELEEHWSPGKLRIDTSTAHTAPGALWSEAYEETKSTGDGVTNVVQATEWWSVTSRCEVVTVPAGQFAALVLLVATGTTPDAASKHKTYWFSPGIGKIKEQGGQTEELVSYYLAEP
jgi:hypothetical protein